MRNVRIWIVVIVFAVGAILAAQVPASQKQTVDQVFASGAWNLPTKAGSGCFTEAVAFTLHQRDPEWGHLRKFGGQNNWNGHAVDAILHRSSGYAVDIIGSSASANARPTWTIDRDSNNQPIARYKGNHSSGVPFWSQPAAGCAPGGGTTPPPPNPPPAPPTSTDLERILESLAAQQQQLEQLRAAVAALVAKPDPVVTLPPIEIPPFTLPQFRCRGNTKAFGGALELTCEP